MQNNNNDDDDDYDDMMVMMIVIITTYVECESKSDSSNKRGDWKPFKITQQRLSNKTEKNKIKELQETAILGTAHVLRKVLM